MRNHSAKSSLKTGRRTLRSLLWLPILLLGCLPAAAQDPWTINATTFVDRTAADSDENLGSRLQLLTRFGAGVEATRRFDLGQGKTINAGFGISHERYPDDRRANRTFIDGSLEHIVPVQWGAVRQLRFSAEATHARDDHDWVFNRGRIAAAVRLQPVQRQTIQLRTRLGYRDQNDTHTFAGYDQSEFLFDAMHLWRSANGSWRTNSTFYYERRSTDYPIYSYDEVGVRFAVHRALMEQMTVVVRFAAFERDYDAGGRNDQRLRATAGIQWDFGDGLNAEAFAGYQDNSSTIAQKDYRGALLGLQFSKAF